MGPDQQSLITRSVDGQPLVDPDRSGNLLGRETEALLSSRDAISPLAATASAAAVSTGDGAMMCLSAVVMAPVVWLPIGVRSIWADALLVMVALLLCGRWAFGFAVKMSVRRAESCEKTQAALAWARALLGPLWPSLTIAGFACVLMAGLLLGLSPVAVSLITVLLFGLGLARIGFGVGPLVALIR